MSTGNEGAIADQDCTSALEDPSDDIVAFNNGFVTLSDLTGSQAAQPEPGGGSSLHPAGTGRTSPGWSVPQIRLRWVALKFSQEG